MPLAIIGFVLHLFSGVILLLFSVRFMRIGIERLWSVQIRNGLGESVPKLSLLVKGAILGFAMQGATVVLLMAAELVAGGISPIVTAIILVLGADLGSALAVRFLTFPVSAIGPFFILVGGWAYLYAKNLRNRNLGRVLLGLGLVLLSLTLIRQAVDPLRGFPGLEFAFGVLNGDPVSAVIFGMALTLTMHSSLAAILVALAFASQGMIGVIGGLGYIIGCNVGSAILPLWLLRKQSGVGQDLARVIAVFRVGLAILLTLVLWAWLQNISDYETFQTVSVMLLGHISFNAILLFATPFVPSVTGLISESKAVSEANSFALAKSSDLDIQLAAMRAQTSRMLDVLSRMLERATADIIDRKSINDLELRLNSSLAELRSAFAASNFSEETPSDDIQMALEFAIRIEACGDIISGKFTNIRQEGLRGDFKFSSAGAAEISELIAQLKKGLLLAQNVIWDKDVSVSRRLVEHKLRVSFLESESRRNHLRRVQGGNLTSLSSSDQHLELIAALKSVNSKIATIGYAVLTEQGALKKSRLRRISGS